MSTPKISIVVCTRNRSKPLTEMMVSLAEMAVPHQLDWELVMVDNGSTDDTPEIIKSYEGTLPLRYVREEKAGLSYARNLGVQTAKGDYIIWTDDDVRVRQDWLSAYLAVFQTKPDGAFFGGRITPVFEGTTPQWLTDNMEILGSAFAKRDLGDRMRRFTEATDDNPFGANFAVRMKEQRRHPYPTDLGVSPKFRRVGEETAVLRAIKDEGGVGYWVPTAEVLHIIPPSRQTLEYVSKHRRAVGETWVYLSAKGDHGFLAEKLNRNGRRIDGVPLWIWRNLIKFWAKYRFYRYTASSTTWLPSFLQYSRYRGAFDFAKASKPFD